MKSLSGITRLLRITQVFCKKNILLPSGFLNLYFNKIIIDLNFFFLNFFDRKKTNLVDIFIKSPNLAIKFFFFWYTWKQFTVTIPVVSDVYKIDDFWINYKIKTTCMLIFYPFF